MSDPSLPGGLRGTLTLLYRGHGWISYGFRWALLVFDCLTIAYFLWAPFDMQGRSHMMIDVAIGAIISLDLVARFIIARHKRNFFFSWLNWADVIVIATMLLPLVISNFAFLRILRAVRAVRTFSIMRRVEVITPFFQRHEDLIEKVTNLVVFVFIMAAVVYATQVGRNEGVNTYIDALYFTVTSLTTTGYGDILMDTQAGRLLAIVIMALGLTLFLQLLRSIVEPSHKVEQECPDCGLFLHDRDAIHCKHCGHVIHIETPGWD